MSKGVYAVLGGISIAATLVGFGHLLGSNAANTSIQILQHDKDEIRHEADRTESENEFLKRQLSASSTPSSGAVQETQQTSSASSNQRQTQDGASPPNSQDATVTAGSSATLFKGVVTISVVAVPLEGEPLRNRVIANITVSGAKPATFDHADVGSMVSTGGYTVQVLSVGFDTATFRVTR